MNAPESTPKALLFRGMKRSGNHALCNWLNSKDDFLFFNNIIPLAAILRGEKTLPPAMPINRWLVRRGPWPFLNYFKARGRNLLFGIEDHPLDLQPFSDWPAHGRQILLLRDPYNLFASRIRKAALVDNLSYARTPGPLFDRAIDLWKSYAREFTGESKTLPANTVRIYFNRWVSDVDYRRQIARSLELNIDAMAVGKVSTHGGGSSFDSVNFDGHANNMPVLDRVGQLTGDERRLFDIIENDLEIAELHSAVEAHDDSPQDTHP